METLLLTSDPISGKVEVRKDQIIAIEELERAGFGSVHRTRIYLKGGEFRDVSESVEQVTHLIH